MIKNNAFTLIELLVVIAIVVLQLAIIVPSLGAAKEQAYAAVCLSNQKQLCLAWTSYSIENKGYREIISTEYCHNFITLDNCEIGNNYNLEFDFSLQHDLFSEFVDPDNLININGNIITWSCTPQNEFFIGNVNGNKSFKPFWCIKNYKTKTGLSESVSSDCNKANLWGTKHVVSPELFYQLNIKPGEQRTWTRIYTFFKL